MSMTKRYADANGDCEYSWWDGEDFCENHHGRHICEKSLVDGKHRGGHECGCGAEE
jgi:hypothetical protein